MVPAEIRMQKLLLPEDDELLCAYSDFLDRLPLAPSGCLHRYQMAKRFLESLKGLELGDLTLVQAAHGAGTITSFFIPFLILHGYLRPGYHYLLSHKLPGPVREFALSSPLVDDLAAARTTATELGFGKQHIDKFLKQVLLRIMVQTGKRLHDLTIGDLEEFRAAVAVWELETGRTKRHWTVSLHEIQNVLYHMGAVNQPATSRPVQARPWAKRLAGIPQPGLRASMMHYVELMAANRRPLTIRGYCWAFLTFTRYLAEYAPGVQQISDLRRQEHIEPWLIWNAARRRLLADGTAQPLSLEGRKHIVLYVKNFLDTINEWGWPEAPSQRLLFNSDIPKLERPLPRYIPHEQEVRLMAAIRELPDPFQRYPLEILRVTGMRIGELINLELDCIHEIPGKGAWLKIPIGKLHTERMVPISPETVVLFDTLAGLRGRVRPLPNPETGRLADFLLVHRGHRVAPEYIRRGLAQAVRTAGLLDAQGEPLRITPHQLRHTFATSLVNSGISVQALMRLLGHVTMEMSLRYGHLFDATVRQQYEEALARVRQQYAPAMLTVKTGALADDHWLEAPKRKTRLAHGYCQIDLSQQVCPHANVCERCPAFPPLPEAGQSIRRQLDDLALLVRDAEARGWAEEVKRHRDLAQRLQEILGEMPAAPSARKRLSRG